MSDLDIRLQAYAPNGALLGPLPLCSSITARLPHLDAGSLEFTYPAQGAGSALLDGDVEVALEASFRGSAHAEITGGRFLVLGSNYEGTDSTGERTFTGQPYGFRLQKAVVVKGSATLVDGRRQFTSATVGGILKTLATEAQGRGALAGIDVSTFSASTDSSGAAWTVTIPEIGYELGLDLLSILQNLESQGWVTSRWVGRSLRLYNGDTGTDKTTGSSPVIVRVGRDIFEAPERTDKTRLANVAYSRGDGSLLVESVSTNPAPWGRWETTINQGGLTSVSLLTSLGQDVLERTRTAAREATRDLRFNEASPLPFQDYSPGDWIYSDTGSGLERMRCQAITLRKADGEVTGNTVLNDVFLDPQLALARKVNGITGGPTGSGGSSILPACNCQPLVKLSTADMADWEPGTAWLDLT